MLPENKFGLQIQLEIIPVQRLEELTDNLLFLCSRRPLGILKEHCIPASLILGIFPGKVCIFDCHIDINLLGIFHNIHSCRDSHTAVGILMVEHIQEPFVADSDILLQLRLILSLKQQHEEIRIQPASQHVVALAGRICCKHFQDIISNLISVVLVHITEIIDIQILKCIRAIGSRLF